MTATDFFTTLPDIPRIYTALSQWLACLVCIMVLRRRHDRLRTRITGIFFLLIQLIFMTITDNAEGILWNLCMIASLLIMYCYIRMSAEITTNMAICCCSTAFVVSEFVASFEWQVRCYLLEFWKVGSLVSDYLMLICIYSILFFFVWKLDKWVYTSEFYENCSWRESWIMLLTAMLVFGVSNLGFLPLKVPFAGRDSVEIFNIRTMVDLGGIAILFAFQSLWKALYIQKELETIQTMMTNQYEQYKQAQRTMDLINYRYHDLKNHILLLRSKGYSQDSSDYLDKLEREIHEYEALNKTGNDVLDTLLTSKNLRCLEHKINMTCVVDGSLFEFMDVMDICAIFGNALDNAIECEIQIADYAKRIIHVDAFKERAFLIIRVENYCEERKKFDRELPVTTKKNSSVHGYGLKSLRYTVHKYKGELYIDISENWFNLRILIPIEM